MSPDLRPGLQQVYIIDDDEAVRDSMAMLLESAGIAHSCYHSADEFLMQYDGEQRGCLVLDIRMPGISGLELQSRLRDIDRALPIIFITGHGDVPMAVEAMRQGAIDFLRKPVREGELLNRINQAFAQDITKTGQINSRSQLQSKVATLTPRELQIFNLVTDGKSNKVIAIDLNISERTVEVHRAKVMTKLGAKTLAELVRIQISLNTE